MKPPTPGLRRLVNDSHDVAKVSLVVPPGDELEVSEDVAAQLQAAGHFVDPATVPPSPPQVVKDANGEVDYEASDPKAILAAGFAALPTVAEVRADTDAALAKKAPTKRAPAKKS